MKNTTEVSQAILFLVMLRLKPNYNLDKLKKIKSLIKEGSSICTKPYTRVKMYLKH